MTKKIRDSVQLDCINEPDYNITSLAPCVQVLGQNKGVCRDDVVGGLDSFQLNTYSRKDGINTISFRRTLKSCGLKSY